MISRTNLNVSVVLLGWPWNYQMILTISGREARSPRVVPELCKSPADNYCQLSQETKRYWPGTAKRLIHCSHQGRRLAKKVLIGHRCSHPGDGGKKIGDPSPVHMRPSTEVAIQNDGNLWIHGCPPKVAIQNNGNLGPLASRSKKRQYSSKQLQGIQLLWEDIVSTRTYINLYNVCGSFLKKQGYNVHLNI